MMLFEFPFIYLLMLFFFQPPLQGNCNFRMCKVILFLKIIIIFFYNEFITCKKKALKYVTGMWGMLPLTKHFPVSVFDWLLSSPTGNKINQVISCVTCLFLACHQVLHKILRLLFWHNTVKYMKSNEVHKMCSKISVTIAFYPLRF